MIQVQNISHHYGKAKALDNVSFEVNEGELFGLIGPDGAGKTTLFRILTTLILPTYGQAQVCGYDVVNEYKRIRNTVGYMPGQFSLYQDLTVEENLHFFATVFQTTLDENYDMIRAIYEQIAPFRHRRAGQLSGGMKQKLALCCALIHRPKVLFLDEPTTGVDPVSRVEFWDMLQSLKQQGITILVSTPYMDEAERCDKMLLIKEGKGLQMDTPEGIRQAYNQPLYAVKGKQLFRLLQLIREWVGTKTCFSFGDSLHLSLQPGSKLEHLYEFLTVHGIERPEIKSIKPTVEDCFIQL